MARGTTLATLRAMLKAEVGDFSGTNAARDAELNQLLANKQQQLLLEKDWPFLVRRWDAVVAPGTRFIAFPTVDADLGETANINLDEIDSVEVFWNQIYTPVKYGIGQGEYNLLNPALQQYADPIQRWREASNINESVDTNMFEVWPVPVTQQTIRFTGERVLLRLTQDTDTADLDDTLIVLGCAAEILMRKKQPDAQSKAQLFARRLHQLGSKLPSRDKVRILGSGVDSGRRSDIKLVAIH